ncbi:ATP-binding protein [Caballeronia sp. HLA56]
MLTASVSYSLICSSTPFSMAKASSIFLRGTMEIEVVVSVSNQGKPIPPQVAAHIFDPLTRTSSPPERRGTAAGVGLGLYICKCIASFTTEC